MSQSADVLYSHLARWVAGYGYIEIGRDDYRTSFIRVLDIGGMIWEGADDYPSLDDALRAADAAVADWLRSQGME